MSTLLQCTVLSRAKANGNLENGESRIRRSDDLSEDDSSGASLAMHADEHRLDDNEWVQLYEQV